MAGPPGYGSPIIFATLSNASPAASSRVRPRGSWTNPARTTSSWVWPPETVRQRYGSGGCGASTNTE